MSCLVRRDDRQDPRAEFQPSSPDWVTLDGAVLDRFVKSHLHLRGGVVLSHLGQVEPCRADSGSLSHSHDRLAIVEPLRSDLLGPLQV